jgi:hypothetical protein
MQQTNFTEQIRLLLFMHEIFCQKVRIPRIPNYLIKMDHRNFHRTKMVTVAHTKYSIRKWGSKLSDDDVGNR